MEKTKKKTLYFEEVGYGLGTNEYNGLSCRIRTAFTNDEGKKVYLELMGCRPGKERKKLHKDMPAYYLHIDAAFYITDDPEVSDCNANQIKTFTVQEQFYIEYTLDSIKDVVNRCFNCSFDEVCIPDSLAGYRVFSGYEKGSYNTSRAYNYGDEFVYDESLTSRRIAKVNELKEHFKKLFNQEYDNTSYYIENSLLMACINVSEPKRLAAGYNERKFVVNV